MIQGASLRSDIFDIWRYRNLDVFYRPDLDGDGRNQAPSFVSYIRKSFGAQARFKSAFEWCAGPAFIGFSLLAEGIVDRLCVADINPMAIDHARMTIEQNGLGDRVRAYVSDNMMDVPSSELFDLVVGNPPTFCNINPGHHDYTAFAGDLRANDPGWKIHEVFYMSIGRYLTSNAHILIQEVEPFERVVRAPAWIDVAWDVRPEPPIERFEEMISSAALCYVGADLFHVGHNDGLRHWIVHSTKL